MIEPLPYGISRHPICNVCTKRADYHCTTSDDCRLFEEHYLCAEHRRELKPKAFMSCAYLHAVSREAINEALKG